MLEAAAWFMVSVTAVQALDLVGHVVNGLKVRRLKAELDLSVTAAKADRDAILKELREARVELRAQVADVKDSLAERFEVVREEARLQAEQTISEARAQLEEQAQQLEADAKARADEYAAQVIEGAKQEAARTLGSLSGAARNAKATARAQVEMNILAALAQRMGDTRAGRLVAWVKKYAPESWSRALNDPDAAWSIIAPVAGIAEETVVQAPPPSNGNGGPGKGW